MDGYRKKDKQRSGLASGTDMRGDETAISLINEFNFVLLALR